MAAVHRTIILNPFAQSEYARQLQSEVSSFCQNTIELTDGPGSATLKAARSSRNGSTIIVAAGGDGTINEVINGIIGSDATLGILPIGSVNVLARQLQIPLSIDQAWRVIEQGIVRKVDLIQAEYASNHQLQTRYFIQMAGIGLDAQIIQQVTWEKKKRWGPASYVLESFKAASKTLPRVTVKTDRGETLEGAFILIGNGSFYGGSIPLFPQASMQDGLMDLCIFESSNFWSLLKYARAVLQGRQSKTQGMLYKQAQSLEIASHKETLPFEVDGEFTGYSPFRFTVLPQALKILVPRLSQNPPS